MYRKIIAMTQDLGQQDAPRRVFLIAAEDKYSSLEEDYFKLKFLVEQIIYKPFRDPQDLQKLFQESKAKKVMIIDDTESIGSLCQVIAEDAGVELLYARNYDEFTAIIGENQDIDEFFVDSILMDNRHNAEEILGILRDKLPAA